MDRNEIKQALDVILNTQKDTGSIFNHYQSFSDFELTPDDIGNLVCSLFLYLCIRDNKTLTKFTLNDLIDFIDSKINK